MSDETRPNVHPDHPDHPDHMPEGEERPPAGVRTMAIVRWSLVALMAFAAVGAWVSYSGVFSEQGAPGQRYQCPMHPTIIMDHPADCPICGMDLVPIEAAKSAAAPAPSAENGGLGKIAEDPFLCPMHLHVGGADASVKCPECGMKLWDREKAIAWAKEDLAKKAAAAPAEPGVPGLVPVELAPERVQLIGVRTAEVGRTALAPELRTVGSVAANEGKVAMVHTRFAGWIEELAAPETGQLVKKGQVLARIYSPDLLSAQEEFLSAMRWAREGGAAGSDAIAASARKRLELLGVSAGDIDAIARRGKAQRALEIRSPVAGYVVEKAAIEGLYVDPGTHLFTVADLSTVWVLADVYEHDVARIRVGQAARLRLAAHPGETFKGKVEFVYPTLDAQTRTLRVRLAFPNPAMKLRPGMYGDAFLALEAAEGLVVPREALVDTGEQQYVFVAKGEGRFEPRAVRTGTRGDDTVEIVEGLSAGERVVTTANFLIDSESRLRAAIQGMAAAPAGEKASPATGAAPATPAAAPAPAGHAGH